MLENTAPISSQSAAGRPSIRQRRKRIDGRYRSARRIKALIAEFSLRVADADSPAIRQAIQRTAELVVLGEDMRGKVFRGEPVGISDLIKIENTIARRLRELGLDRPRPRAAPSLDSYLATITGDSA